MADVSSLSERSDMEDESNVDDFEMNSVSNDEKKLPKSSKQIFCELKSVIEIETLNMLVDLRGRGNVPYSVSVDILKFFFSFDDYCG